MDHRQCETLCLERQLLVYTADFKTISRAPMKTSRELFFQLRLLWNQVYEIPLAFKKNENQQLGSEGGEDRTKRNLNSYKAWICFQRMGWLQLWNE